MKRTTIRRITKNRDLVRSWLFGEHATWSIRTHAKMPERFAEVPALLMEMPSRFAWLQRVRAQGTNGPETGRCKAPREFFNPWTRLKR